MKQTHFFLGANSAEGFYGLYDQLLDARLYDLIILKGTPGRGKSTFMRRAAAALEERGLETVYIHCSGDPDSLDGVIAPAIRTAIVDGTAPHGTAPLGHHAKKVRICKALRGRNYDGSSTRHGTNRILLQDKLFEVRRNCSIKKIKFSEIGSFNGKIA